MDKEQKHKIVNKPSGFVCLYGLASLHNILFKITRLGHSILQLTNSKFECGLFHFGAIEIEIFLFLQGVTSVVMEFASRNARNFQIQYLK